MQQTNPNDSICIAPAAITNNDVLGSVGYPRPYYRVSAERASRVRGCLLAGAVGDALGAPVEFDNLDAIHEKFGPRGVQTIEEAFGRVGSITDNTQLTLFTAEGLLRAHVRGTMLDIFDFEGDVNRAYLRWLHTQNETGNVVLERNGYLLEHQELYQRRAAGNTCRAALKHRCGPRDASPAKNDSKGCGGVMRVAPVGLYFAEPNVDNGRVFDLGCAIAALTHGHPTGQHSAGALAVMIAETVRGKSLRIAAESALKQLRPLNSAHETRQAILAALELSASHLSNDACLPKLGQGWLAEGALAIGLFCALRAESLRDGLLMAVNVTGDSDTTGAIAGNLLGAERGVHEIPDEWLAVLELRALITEIADDLASSPKWRLDKDGAGLDQTRVAYWLNRYPMD